MCYCCCMTKSRSGMRGLIIVYTVLMLFYHLYEIRCDLTEIFNPYGTTGSTFREMFDHMDSYRPLLYVSLIANIIVIIILCCLFYYAIKNRASLVEPFRFIYPFHLIYYTILFIYRLGYALIDIYTSEPSDGDCVAKVLTMLFFICKILYISLGFDFYFAVRRYSRLDEEDQKCDVSDFETV